MMTKITVKGRYTGSSDAGIIVGGIRLTRNMGDKVFLVDEQTYNKLLRGEMNGWFKMSCDNYAQFLKSRLRKTEAKNIELATFEEVIDAVTETLKEVVEEAPVEEAPVEEAPVEEAPVEEAPVEEAPVEEAPVEEAPVEEAPAEKKKKTSKKKAE